MESRPPREMHLLEYWQILRKRRWVVVTAMSVLFTTVTIGSFLITPSFRSTAVIQIERENPNIVNFRELYAQDNSYLAYGSVALVKQYYFKNSLHGTTQEVIIELGLILGTLLAAATEDLF